MMKLANLFYPAFLLVCSAAQTVWAMQKAAHSPPPSPSHIEFIHNWSLPSEINALEVLLNASQVPQSNIRPRFIQLIENREYVIERISHGHAPDISQWFPGPELDLMADLGVLHPLTELAHQQVWSSKVLPQLLQDISHNGEYWALPINLHTRNMLWINTKIFQQLNLTHPTTWDEFLTLAPKLKAQSISPLAIGDTARNRMVLWTTIVLSQAGSEQYRKLMLNELNKAEMEKLFLQSFSLLAQIKPYVNQFTTNSTSIAGKLASEEVAMWLSGDWAKSELKNIGLQLGKDFDCTMAPGNSDIALYSPDVFIFPRKEESNFNQNLARFVSQFLTERTQIEFNLAKGSMPVLNNINIDQFDKCTQLTHKIALTPNGLTPSFLSSADDVISFILETTIQDFWQQKISVEEVAHNLTKELLSVQK